MTPCLRPPPCFPPSYQAEAAEVQQVLAADVKGEQDLMVGQLDNGFRCAGGGWMGGGQEEGSRRGEMLEGG